MINVKTIRDENNLFSKSLNEENREVFTDIVCYLRVSDLSEMEQEEVSGDILRMFLDWQNQGKDINDMIGKDYKKFADDIISAVNPHKSVLQKVKEYALILVEAFFYLLTIDFIFIYLPKMIRGDLSFVYHYSLDMAVRGLLIFTLAVIVVTYIGKNSFRLSKNSISKPVRFLIGSCVGGLIILCVLLTKILSSVILVSINISYILVLLAAFWLYKGIKRIYKLKLIR